MIGYAQRSVVAKRASRPKISAGAATSKVTSQKTPFFMRPGGICEDADEKAAAKRRTTGRGGAL
jgi:hypothetical protein